jgi:phage gpG-like protein
MDSFNEHRKILKKIEEMKPKLNKIVDSMGIIAKNHFTKSFSDQGFTDETLQHWTQRKRNDRGRNRGSRGILIKSGRLRRSLQVRKIGSFAINISSSVPYARVHNYGERSGRGKGFIMPKRQFVGYSGQMNRKIIAKFDVTIKKFFNK